MEVCNLCNKLFSNQSNLGKRIKSVHEKMKFKCEICGKEFSQKDDLQRHKKAVHSKSIEFKCTVCERKFSRKNNCWHIKKSVANVDIATNNFPLHRSFLIIFARKKIQLNRPQNVLNPMNQLFKCLLYHFLQIKFKTLNNQFLNHPLSFRPIPDLEKV